LTNSSQQFFEPASAGNVYVACFCTLTAEKRAAIWQSLATPTPFIYNSPHVQPKIIPKQVRTMLFSLAPQAQVI
jgi:hypothetical protein